MLRVDTKTAQTHVHQVSTFLIPRMMDQNLMVRQAVVQLVMRLMQATSPVTVIGIMSDNVHHKSPRVRQMTVDLVTAALLTHPRCDFDLPALCGIAVPALVDQKKAVRHAAMECVAAVAQALGAGKLQPLMSAVDRVEEEPKYEGLMAAVQARLSRRQLPSVTDKGLVEYATTVRGTVTGVDVDWIRSGLYSLDSPVRSESFEVKTSTASPSRHHVGMSAKSLHKLPWEKDAAEVCNV